jgi:signal transduction histidine kinase/ActR/RegA family two-component response regulator
MLLVVGLGFAVSGALQLDATRRALNRQMDGLGSALARSAAASVVEWVLERQHTYVQTYVDSVVMEDEQVAFLVVRLPSGQIVASRPEGDPRRMPRFRGCRVYEQAIRVPGAAAGLEPIGTVTLGLLPDETAQVIAQRTRQMATTFVATFAVLALVVTWLLRRMLHEPLSRLDRLTRRLALGDLEYPVQTGDGTEIGRLAHTLEAMRVSLKASHESIARQNEQLLALDRMKTEFLANLSHEVRTPLTALIGFTDLLAAAPLAGEARGQLETIRRNALHLHSLLNELLDLARLGTGELLIEKEPFDPRALVLDLFEFVRFRAQSKGLELVLDVRDPVPPTVVSDATRIRQVLLQLAGNAIKFTERGRVNLELATEVGPDGARRLVFRVADTGPGVPPALRAKLFEPWTQADAALSRRIQGLGIGLSIASAIARRLGGTLGCESRDRAGSTFTFTLPITDDPVPAVAPAAAPSLAVAPARVLLAEDAPDNQRLVSLMLRKAGYEVTVAGNGKLACEAAEQARAQGTPFDLILMDIQMPELDGCAATRWLREHGFAQPIVAVTAHSMESDRQRCLEAGCDDYLTKPLVADKLIQVVRRELTRG